MILEFIKEKAKTNLKFSHLCFWNLLSCKYFYKKIIDLQSIKGIMIELMNDWEHKVNQEEKFYISIFTNYNSFEDFCHNNLIFFNNTIDYVKDDSIAIDKIKGEIMRTQINTAGRVEKWRYYVSSLNFVNDIILMSDLLKNISKDKRNSMLKQVISYINKENVPVLFYDFFDNEFNIKSLIRINSDFSFSLSTKDHVPYHLLLELSDSKDLITLNDQNEINNGFISSSYEENEQNFMKSIIRNSNKSINNPISSEDKKAKSVTKETNSYLKYFTLSYYFPSMSSIFSCSPSNEANQLNNEEEDLSVNNMNHAVSPDSIGIFGSLSFSEISSKIKQNNKNTKKLLPLIIKRGEDLRQDLFVSQIINIFLSIFKTESLPIFLQPLNVLSIGRGGIMETIIDTTNLMKINKVDYTQFDGYSSSTLYIEPVIDSSNLAQSSLRNYFIFKYGDNTKELETAISNFVLSLTGYSLLCYLLEIKDRNNGNILINDKGNLIHIDFGFLLSCSPGNVNFERAPFKLTYDFVELMKGVDSEYFAKYREMFYKGFIALRKNYMLIIGFIEMFMATNLDLPCFYYKEDLIDKIKLKFLLEEKDDDTLKKKINSLIDSSLNNWRTKMYDGFQKYCVGIN